MLPLSFGEIRRRSPVWEAFADLFLDTDPALHYDYIVRTMQESPFPREELWHILADEVAPAFLFNLSLVAGEWAGWEAAYVRRRILAHMVRRRLLRRFGLRPRSSVYTYVHEQWQHVLGRWDGTS